LIVDDEELARHVIREFLQSHSEIDVAAESRMAWSGKSRRRTQAYLIFLDVQMPKLTGFDVLELIGTERTGHFRDRLRPVRHARLYVHAVDYLLKPLAASVSTRRSKREDSLGEKMSAPTELSAAARSRNNSSSASS